MSALSSDEKTRYDRQMMLPNWGEAGQERLSAATAFVAGAGGLGSPAAIYLAVAGVGELRICDSDTIELSNLNRQILHSEERIGMSKAISGRTALAAVNSSIRVEALTTMINAENVDELVGGSDIIVDCMDNFDTRYVLNDCAIRKGIPFVHGSVWGLAGQLTFIHVPQTPCLRCIFPEGPVKELFPVVGCTPGVIGCLQAVEAIKYLVGLKDNLKGELLLWDGELVDFQRVKVRRDPSCPDCGAAGR